LGMFHFIFICVACRYPTAKLNRSSWALKK
jgi:ribosomal protein L37E